MVSISAYQVIEVGSTHSQHSVSFFLYKNFFWMLLLQKTNDEGLAVYKTGHALTYFLYLDLFDSLFEPIIPKAIVNPLSYQL